MTAATDTVAHASRRSTITEKGIANLKAELGERLELADTVVPQLRLRVSQRGKKYWSVIYRVSGAGEGGLKGKMRRMTLGDYPRITIAKARDGARDALDAAERGVDPALQRKVEAVARNERTFEAVAERFIDEYAKVEQKEWKSTKAYLDNYVVPIWRGRIVEEIRRSDVTAMLAKVRTQGIERARERAAKAGKPRSDERHELSGLSAAREVRKRVRKLFNWAAEEDLVLFNPAAGLSSKTKSLAYSRRDRALSLHELRRVWDAAEEFGYRYGPMVQLLILTGQRRSEVAGLNRDWLDMEERYVRVPASGYKTDREHIYPLSAPAVAIIEALPSYGDDDSHFLFPTDSGDGPISGFSKAKLRLDSIIAEQGEKEGLAPLEPWTLHDIRRSVKTGMSRLGVPHLHSEQVLGHVIPGVGGVYDVYDYMQEKRAALDLWAEHLIESMR